MCPIPSWRISGAWKDTSATPTQKLTQRYFSSRPGDRPGAATGAENQDPARCPRARAGRACRPEAAPEPRPRRVRPLRPCATSSLVQTARASSGEDTPQGQHTGPAHRSNTQGERTGGAHRGSAGEPNGRRLPLPRPARSVARPDAGAGRLRSERDFVVHAAAEAAARSPTGPAARTARRTAAVATARTTR